MHGIIHSQLARYVRTKHSPDAWLAVLDKAGLGSKIYLANRAYPDEDAGAIVAAASELTGAAPDAILEDFGEFICPTLQFERIGPNTLKLTYDSPRRMLAVGKGIIRGVAKHYGNSVAFQERPGIGNRSELTVDLG